MLRPATPDDLPLLEELARSEPVASVLAPGAADALAGALERDGEELLVVEHEGRTVGAARMVVRSSHSRIVTLASVMLDPAVRGIGLGVATVRALTRRAFEDGFHRVEAEVYGFNEAGRRTFVAAGFTHEGTRRAAYDRHGAWQDGIVFGLVGDTPPRGTAASSRS
jgi:RimJ/RimL family protein N-acetyltransferase